MIKTFAARTFAAKTLLALRAGRTVLREVGGYTCRVSVEPLVALEITGKPLWTLTVGNQLALGGCLASRLAMDRDLLATTALSAHLEVSAP